MAAFRGEREFLSNFYPCPKGVDIGVNDLRGRPINFVTAEHAFAFMKIDDSDWPTKELIVLAATPGQAKRLGRSGKMRPGWEEPGSQGKISTMLRILEAKFGQDPDLASRLLNTGDERLVEYNEWHDNFWGSCTCANCERVRLTQVGRPREGQNWLGQLLMQVRAAIRGRWTEAEARRGYK